MESRRYIPEGAFNLTLASCQCLLETRRLLGYWPPEVWEFSNAKQCGMTLIEG